MNWFLIALINPITHALVNHLDKYLISRYMKGGSVGTLVLFSAMFSIVALPIIYFFNTNIFNTITWSQAIILMINGAILVAAIIFYLYALESDEASIVAPLFQLIPVFGFVFGYLILNETLNGSQLWAALLIILGSLLLSLDLNGKQTKVKTKLLFLMFSSTLCYALNAVVFKSIAADQGFLNSLFWDLAGKFIFGLILFLSVRSYHKQFIQLLRLNSFAIVGLNIFNEILALIGEIALVLAILYAPVVLVQSVAGIQPLFVLIIGIVLSVLFPQIVRESLRFKHMTQKIVGIAIIIGGVLLLEMF